MKSTLKKESDMMESKIQLIKQYQNIIDAIRYCHTNDKTLLSRVAGVSWPTVNNFFKQSSSDLVLINNDSFNLKAEFGFFLGIAIGSKETKVSLMDFNFQPVCQNSYDSVFREFFVGIKENKYIQVKPSEDNIICITTGEQVEEISDLLNQLISFTLSFFEYSIYDLLGIGISFPGIIDRDTLIMQFCPNIRSLTNFNLLNLINIELLDRMRTNRISLYIGHDTTAITVFEKEQLYFKNNDKQGIRDKGTIICLYWGTGLGAGVIIDNHLVSEKNFAAGEIGHIECPVFLINPSNHIEEGDMETYTYEDEDGTKKITALEIENVSKCYCSINNCLERGLRFYVFNSDIGAEYVKKTAAKELNSFTEKHPYRYKVLKRYLRFIFNILINLYNPDVIFLCGPIFSNIIGLEKELGNLKQSSAIYYTQSKCEIYNGSNKVDAVALGAAILSYYKMKENVKNEFRNFDLMKFDVLWPTLN